MNESVPYVEHFVTLRDGLRMYCREYGAAHRSDRPVLCLPGLTRNCRDFESLARGLSNQWRVLTPDLRGRGRSDYDPNWQNYQPMTYVADVGELLQQRDVSRVVVIGTSLGGLIGMLMAALNPSRRSLAAVLNDVGPEIDPAGLARIAGYVGKLPPVHTWDDAAAQARLVNGAALPDYTDEDWMRFAQAAPIATTARAARCSTWIRGSAMRCASRQRRRSPICGRCSAGWCRVPALAIRGAPFPTSSRPRRSRRCSPSSRTCGPCRCRGAAMRRRSTNRCAARRSRVPGVDRVTRARARGRPRGSGRDRAGRRCALAAVRPGAGQGAPPQAAAYAAGSVLEVSRRHSTAWTTTC